MKFRRKLFYLTAAIFLFSAALSCTSTKNFQNDFSESENSLAQNGISLSLKEYNETLYYLAQIDLTFPDLEIVFFPEEVNDEGWFKTEGIKTFSEKQQAVLAVNVTPFEIKNEFSSWRKIAGLYKLNEKIISPEIKKYCAIGFTKKTYGKNETYKAEIFSSQTDFKIENFENAAGGFFIILDENGVKEFPYPEKEANIAFGISKEGSELFILGCNRKSFGKEKGLTFSECGKILQQEGCTKAMICDGGHSAQLVFNGKTLVKRFPSRKPAVQIGFKIKDKTKMQQEQNQ